MAKKSWTILLFIFISGSFLYLTYGVESHYWLIIKLRLVRWCGIVVVAVAMATSTLLFQTLTQNIILTPSIIGFDSLFVLLKTLLMFFLGSLGFISISDVQQFILLLLIMSGMAIALFYPLIKNLDITRLILAGVIFSVLFRSIASFLQRIFSPEDYLVLQSALFANFHDINSNLLLVSTILVSILIAICWQLRFVLDVIMLGKSHAIGLGITYKHHGYTIVIIVSLLVAIATALVGPLSFFGLIVCALSNQLTSSMKHSIRIPLVMLISSIILIVGQGIFEHFLNMKSTLSVIVDCIGGIVFLILIKKNITVQGTK